MPTAVGAAIATIVGWVTTAGSATAIAAGTVATAVTGAAIKGAVYGAVIGAGTSAIRGDDILEGALKGATAGGIAGGIYSAGSMVANWATQGTLGTAAASQVANLTPVADVGTSAEMTATGSTAPGGFVPAGGPPAGAPSVATPPPSTGLLSKAGSTVSDIAKKVPGEVWGGVVSGVGQGLLSGMNAEDEAERQDKIRRERAGAVGEVPERTIGVGRIGERSQMLYKKYIQPPTGINPALA